MMLEWLYQFSGRHPRLRPMAGRLCNLLTGARWCVRGAGHRVDVAGAFLCGAKVRLEGRGHTVTIASGARLGPVEIVLRGAGHTLTIGADVNMKAGSLHVEDAGGCLVIGADTTIERADIAVTEGGRIQVGKDCMLAFGIDIRNGDSHAIRDVVTGERLNLAADVILEDHVWVGAYAQVLKGVRIGRDSIIGARSVVTGEVPAGVTAAGVPARVVRSGVAWSRKR